MRTRVGEGIAAQEVAFFEHLYSHRPLGRGGTMLNAYGLYQLGRAWEFLTERVTYGSYQQVSEIADLVVIVRGLLADEPAYSEVYGLLVQEADRLSSQGTEPVRDYHRRRLNEFLSRCEGRLEPIWADLAVIQSKSNFKTERLTNPDIALQQLGATLSTLEEHDFREASLCLLVGAYTAAEFAALRFAESMAIRWHQKVTQAAKPMDTTLGVVLGELEKHYAANPPVPKEVKLVDHLNDRRIEVDHPKRASSLQDAEFTMKAVELVATGLASRGDLPAIQSATGSGAP